MQEIVWCCVQALHVINYDFPCFVSDYIHRIGRVGRVRSTGSCFALSFVSYKWDVELLWKIEVVLSVAVFQNTAAKWSFLHQRYNLCIVKCVIFSNALFCIRQRLAFGFSVCASGHESGCPCFHPGTALHQPLQHCGWLHSTQDFSAHNLISTTLSLTHSSNPYNYSPWPHFSVSSFASLFVSHWFILSSLVSSSCVLPLPFLFCAVQETGADCISWMNGDILTKLVPINQ